MEPRARRNRCTALTKAGSRCRRPALASGPGAAEQLCTTHSGRTAAGEGDARRCTATTKAGRRCRRPAIASSGAAQLCTVHAGLTVPHGEDRRRCTATARAGNRCRRWAVRGTSPPRCPTHAGRFAPAGDEPRRCTAIARSGVRCRQWAVRGSEARYGQPLCPAHARVAAGGTGWHWPGPEDDAAGRRCKAITRQGRQCRNWALAGTDPPLCRGHRYPEQHSQIRHGLYRPGWGLGPLEREALAVAWRTGRPLDAEVLLARLLARALLGYLSTSPRPREQDMNGIRLLLRALGAVRRVVAARRELAQEELTIFVPPELAHLLPSGRIGPGTAAAARIGGAARAGHRGLARGRYRRGAGGHGLGLWPDHERRAAARTPAGPARQARAPGHLGHPLPAARRVRQTARPPVLNATKN
jgi:hypothetical protein